MKLKELEKLTNNLSNTPKMPVLFIGHGHPMNALYDNTFTQKLQMIASNMMKPNAIMMVSAHWETKGTYVSVNAMPKTIYDFGRFDDRLFQIKYEPKGHPELANEVIDLANEFDIKANDHMGLDHGAWTVLKYIYPNADVPVFQLSIDYTQNANYHFKLANALKKMREKGVLIIGSGNIVHNLGNLDWRNIDAKPFDWAVEFDEIVKHKLVEGNFEDLIHYQKFGNLASMAIPTNDHYLPMIYTLGLKDKKERVETLYEGMQYGSISMRCFKIA